MNFPRRQEYGHEISGSLFAGGLSVDMDIQNAGTDQLEVDLRKAWSCGISMAMIFDEGLRPLICTAEARVEERSVCCYPVSRAGFHGNFE